MLETKQDENDVFDYSKISTFRSCGTSPFKGAGEAIRVVDEKIDLIYPKVPFPSNKLFTGWGETNIRNMVHYHHSLLRKSSIGDLFSNDDAIFEFATKKTADFFVEALGGGNIYSAVYGHPALRMRHFHITIDEKAREIWLMMYKKTIKDLCMPVQFIEEFWNWIEPLSIRMINRRTTVLDIPRFSFKDIFIDLVQREQNKDEFFYA